jgi:hypothetical protein
MSITPQNEMKIWCLRFPDKTSVALIRRVVPHGFWSTKTIWNMAWRDESVIRIYPKTTLFIIGFLGLCSWKNKQKEELYSVADLY